MVQTLRTKRLFARCIVVFGTFFRLPLRQNSLRLNACVTFFIHLLRPSHLHKIPQSLARNQIFLQAALTQRCAFKTL